MTQLSVITSFHNSNNISFSLKLNKRFNSTLSSFERRDISKTLTEMDTTSKIKVKN
jgi:hypothetical protein